MLFEKCSTMPLLRAVLLAAALAVASSVRREGGAALAVVDEGADAVDAVSGGGGAEAAALSAARAALALASELDAGLDRLDAASAAAAADPAEELGIHPPCTMPAQKALVEAVSAAVLACGADEAAACPADCAGALGASMSVSVSTLACMSEFRSAHTRARYLAVAGGRGDGGRRGGQGVACACARPPLAACVPRPRA